MTKKKKNLENTIFSLYHNVRNKVHHLRSHIYSIYILFPPPLPHGIERSGIYYFTGVRLSVLMSVRLSVQNLK